ncbi:hypothetical protein LCGC14_0503760 [marine sediment metagenome]|uniref:Uncharacterized protein n=1 Tax=marine sediment metagenome TaxID=412755 RepID=A0A0F9VBR8_9ZZZZ
MSAIAAGVFPFKYIEAQGSPVDNSLVIGAGLVKRTLLSYRNFEAPATLKIKVVVGTFQFALNANPVSANPAITTTDDVLEISVDADDVIYFKANAQNDSFNIYG